jgi:hypothetical protein
VDACFLVGLELLGAIVAFEEVGGLILLLLLLPFVLLLMIVLLLGVLFDTILEEE